MSSPSVPPSLPSLSWVIGMSPFMAMVSLPGWMVFTVWPLAGTVMKPPATSNVMAMNADFTRGHVIVSSHSLCVSKIERTHRFAIRHSTLGPSLKRVNQTHQIVVSTLEVWLSIPLRTLLPRNGVLYPGRRNVPGDGVVDDTWRETAGAMVPARACRRIGYDRAGNSRTG